ncbi:MAG: hypothetical protein ABEJ56_01340 [Candidatus Nanohaloarchaea archaeon]
MSSSANQNTPPEADIETERRAERYEDFVDYLLDEGRVFPDNRELLEKPYSEMEPGEKLDALATFYNEIRDARTIRQEYTGAEILDYLESIIESPESIESEIGEAGRKDFEDLPEVEIKKQIQRETGGYPDEESTRHTTQRMGTGEDGEWVQVFGILDWE